MRTSSYQDKSTYYDGRWSPLMLTYICNNRDSPWVIGQRSQLKSRSPGSSSMSKTTPCLRERCDRAGMAAQSSPRSSKDYINIEKVILPIVWQCKGGNDPNFMGMLLSRHPPIGAKTERPQVVMRHRPGTAQPWYNILRQCIPRDYRFKKNICQTAPKSKFGKKYIVWFMGDIYIICRSRKGLFFSFMQLSKAVKPASVSHGGPSFPQLGRYDIMLSAELTSQNMPQILQGDVNTLQLHTDEQQRRNLENGYTYEFIPHIESDTTSEVSNLKSEENKKIIKIVSGTVKLSIQSDAVRWLAEMCGGDARSALNTLQTLVQSHTGEEAIAVAHAKEALQRTHVMYDRKGDEHYSFASALQKSIRGGDDNAALYWTMRMVKGGEDPKFIARRLVRTASEDIGLGDPNALSVAVSAMQAVQMLGMPESDVILAQCAVYLARAKHNPEVYQAMNRVKEHMNNHTGLLPTVPLHLRNASTSLQKKLGYGNGYSYDPSKVRGIKYMPEELEGTNFFKD
ncbi:unnamed protein product, partial [Meganyctiphanes norvegica]